MGLVNTIKKILLTGTLAVVSSGITSCGDSELRKKVEGEMFDKNDLIAEMVAVEKEIMPEYDGKETVVVYRGEKNKGGIIFFRRKENSYESIHHYLIPQITKIDSVDVMDENDISKEGFRHGLNPYDKCAKVKYTFVTDSGRKIELAKIYPCRKNQVTKMTEFMEMIDIRR